MSAELNLSIRNFTIVFLTKNQKVLKRLRIISTEFTAIRLAEQEVDNNKRAKGWELYEIVKRGNSFHFE